jgi:hypothetical protein
VSENRDLIGEVTVQNESVPDFMDAHFEAAGITTEGGDESSAGTSTESGASTEGAAPSQDKVEGASGKDSVSGKQDKSGEPGKTKEGKDTSESLPAGAIKLKDGTIVNAGPERRWYDQAHIARQRLHATSNDLNTVTQKYNALKGKYDQISETVTQMGLQKPEEMQSAMSLFKDIRSDPVGTVTKLLADLKAKGYDVSNLVGGVDTKAIEAVLDRRIGPSETNQGKQTAEQIAADVDKEISEFYGNYPEAEMHDAYIAAFLSEAAKQGQKDLPIREAWFMFQERAMADGFDLTKPIQPQIEARKQAASGQQQQPQQQKQDTPAPRPNGRVPAGASEEINPDKSVVASADTSTEDIIRSVMKEQGFNIG